MNSQVTFGVVGTGWRAQFYLRLARLLPDRLAITGVGVRRASTAARVTERWGLPAYLSPAELARHQRPDFVVSSVPWKANPGTVTALVEAGMRVLSETPPAPDIDGLRALWSSVGRLDQVQVAEQYLLMPGHAARREIVARGSIGTPSSVQVSSTHNYHAVSMMRGLLGTGFDPPTVSAHRFTAPLVDPLSRDGWTDDDTPRPATTTVATVDFGDGRSGLYDFTDNQWHNQLRTRRIVVRGSHGEITDDDVVRLAGPRTILRSTIGRRQLGYDLDLDGYDTDHLSFDGEVVYRNPFLGARLMDEEIAIASMLVATGAWARDEAAGPYPLAQGCQDHLLGLAIEQAADLGTPITPGVEPWAH